MQAAEGLKLPMQELPKPEFGDKVKIGLEKIKTSVGDFIRDIDTANQMAKDKFDGDSALMHAARGGMTGLVGVGLDEALDNVLSKGLKQGEVWIGRQKLPLGKETIDQLAQLGKKYPRIRYFIESASKNFITGLAYNTVAHFSGHALPTAEPKHFLSSLAASATESMGPKGKDGVHSLINEPLPTDSLQAAKLLEKQAIERNKAFQNARDPKIVEESVRKALIEELEKEQANIRDAWANAKANGVSGKDMIDIWPLPLSKRKMTKARYGIEGAAIKAGLNAQKLRHELLTQAFKAKIESDKLNNSLKHSKQNGNDQLSWKETSQKIIKYANPATLLGIDWMVEGVATLGKNFGEVRKVRKEKGGMLGKKIEMEKKQVHYGSSNWQDRNRGGRS